jgi:transcriptional regulator with XRE-family HTH domain
MNSTLKDFVGLIACMQLKDRIREAMEGAGLGKAEFARATKSTPGAVTQWLSGETKSIKAEKSNLMEIATGYSASWIVTGKGQKMAADKFPLTPDHIVAMEKDTANNGISIPADVHMLMRVLDALPTDLRANAVNAALSVLVQHLPRAVPSTPSQARDVTQASIPG